MLVERDFTLFNLTNPKKFFYKGETPVLEEMGPYTYYEYTYFKDLEYLNDDKYVKSYLWRYYIPKEGTTGKERVNTINYPALGIWY